MEDDLIEARAELAALVDIFTSGAPKGWSVWDELGPGDFWGGTIFPVTGEGSVYFARAVGTDLVKIGFTKGEIGARLSGLRTGCPYELVLEDWFAGVPNDEREAHAGLRARRGVGEWFRLTPNEVRQAAASGWRGLALRCCPTCDNLYFDDFDGLCAGCAHEALMAAKP